MLTAPSLSQATNALVWIHSDLQLGNPDLARQVLAAAVDDVLDLKLDIAAAWCLGDALVGNKVDALQEVAQASIEQMDRLNVPVCYVFGNHELDLCRLGDPTLPLYKQAVAHPLWHTMPTTEDFYFAREICGNLVIFMGDHLAADGSWWTSHGRAHTPAATPLDQDAPPYPHKLEAYQQLRQAMIDYPGPVITASHYAYPGGQRPSDLMGLLLPLPENHRLHMYGHAHIGDLVHNKETPYQRENPITGQPKKQFNISALETARSAGSHSAFLELTPQGPQRLRIRCHQSHQWTETFEL